MVGVGQDNLRLGLILHVAVEDALHRCGSAYGHKYGGLDHAVVGGDKSRARLTLGRCMLQFKFHTQYITRKCTKKLPKAKGRRDKSTKLLWDYHAKMAIDA